MEKNAAAGRTPSSVPMSTPPPVALNVPSPKLAPMSPVHTNSLHDAKSHTMRNDSHMPEPHIEDDRLDERNDRYPPGVSSGTLDAIRERMKSIQLAAAAGNPDTGNRSLMYMNGNLGHGQLSYVSDHAEHELPVQAGVHPMDEKALSGLQARMERLKSGTIEPL